MQPSATLGMSVAASPIAALGMYLTAGEAQGIAAMLRSGEHVNRALREVAPSRRAAAKQLIGEAGLGHDSVDLSVPVLEGIAGAKSTQLELTPVWTMPGNEAELGHLTGQFHRLVLGARVSVTAATYNFTVNSNMWKVLKEASERPGVEVAVYVDGDKADAEQVKAQMPKAGVYRSCLLPDGKQVVSHAKFVIIDHALMLLTSANFSYSAENLNVEFGLLVEDPSLAESVEDTMASKRGVLYERVD